MSLGNGFAHITPLVILGLSLLFGTWLGPGDIMADELERDGVSIGRTRMREMALASPPSASAIQQGLKGGSKDGYIPSPEPGWPQWRGPRRDGIFDETGLLDSWPDQGPRLLWRCQGLGRGYSSPVIGRDRIYITGDVGEELRIFALDMEGNKIWEAVNGASWRENYAGSRACCALSEGRVYHMNGHGRLACLDADNGGEIWAVDTVESFGGRIHTWGRSECVLVDGMNVIATPAGEDAFMVALNKETGEVVWRSEPVLQEDKSFPSYASPILLCWEGRRLIVQSGLRTIVCVDADAGRVLWTHPERTKYDANCATPVYVDGGIFHPIPSGAGGTFLEMSLHANNIRVAEKWRCPMDNVSGGAVAVQGHLYGSAERNGGWMCVNVDTGRVLYNDRTLHKGSVIQAEGHLYCMEERGTMALVKATPKEFLIVSRFAFVEEHRNDVWAHPVLLDGTLYLRYHDELSRYAVK